MQRGTLGPYRLDRELGAGGMGKVWAATVEGRVPGLDVGRVVALKVVHPHLLETPGFFKRFLREAEIGKAVVHENVVRTFDCDSLTADGKRADFLVMEYVEGQTLRSLLAELERVPEELCRHIGREVAKGLAAIHAAGVVHRDMKPENVLITGDHQIKVMDLGVARLQDEAMRLSQTGAFVGSIHYAAPEAFREGGKHVDGRADLHALGLVLYELACGVNPYLAADVAQVLRKVLQEEPRRLGDVNPQLSPFFEEVVHTLLAKDPAARFADAAALVAVLDEGEKSEWWRNRAKVLRAETRRPLRRIRIPRETAVYGREAELSKLHALFEKAKAGDGQVVLIEGEAGIGKSRVVDELIGRLQRDGEDLNFLFGSYPPGGAATAAGAFSTAFREHLGDADLAAALTEKLGAARVLASAFAALLLGTSTPTGAEPLTKDSLQTCFVHTTCSLAAERPTVLLIDDLHFATEDARALFTSLALAAPGHRVLLVGTTRPGIDEKWLAGLTRLPQTSPMALPRLGPKDLALLLEDSLRSVELARSLAMQIGLKSDGNPFFAFEIIRGLREGQFITQRDDGTWVSTREIGEIRIPSSVMDLVNARVADLTQEERDLLDVAACWGFEFDPLLVGDAVGVARIPLLKALSLIERKHRLVRSVGQRFVFDHHQVQEALYEGLPQLLRESYHAALADALAARTKAAEKDPAQLDGALCVDLCRHFLDGARAESALRYLAPAQTHLQKSYLHARALELGERALAVPDLLCGAERAKALLDLCRPLEALRRFGRHEECVLEAERLAEDAGHDALRRRAVNDVGTQYWFTGRPREAEAAYRRALELARAAGDRDAEAGATVNIGNALSAQGRAAEAKDQFARGIELCRAIGQRLFESNALLGLSILFRTEGRIAETKDHLERALVLSREVGSRRGELLTSGNLGVLCHNWGRLAEAKERYEQTLALSREIGDRQSEAIAQHNLGAVARDEGALDASEEHQRTCLALCEGISDHALEAHTHLALASLRAALGSADEGRQALAAARDRAQELGYPVYAALARLELAGLPGGDPADALAAWEQDQARLGDPEQRREARYLQWKATGDRAHLVEAKRLLDEAAAQVDEETRGLMLTKLYRHRAIVEACRAEGIA